MATAGQVWSRTAQEDDAKLLSTTPGTLRLFGTVTDAQQRPVAGASLRLVLPEYHLDVLSSCYVRQPKLIDAVTQSDGRYEIEVSSQDERLRNAFDITQQHFEPFVVVDHPEHQIAFHPIPLRRMAVELPLDFALEPRSQPRLLVLAADGTPVSGAEVKVAQYDEVILPHRLDSTRTWTTDQDGMVQLPGIDLERTVGVYVVSAEWGNQVAKVNATADGYHCQLVDVGSVTGKVLLPADAASPVMEGRRVLLMRYAVASSNLDGTWAVATLNAEGEFAVSRVGQGSLMARLLDWDDWPFRHPESVEYRSVELRSGDEPLSMELPFEAAVPIRLQFVDELGRPVAGMGVEPSAAWRRDSPQVSDSQGYLHSWRFAGRPLAGQVFLCPTSWDYLSPELSVFYLDKREWISEDTVAPISLVRTRALRGRTVDARGQAIAGATVNYGIHVSNWQWERSTLSDVNGHFHILGLPPNANVQLSAQQGERRTAKDQITDRVAGDTEEIELVLEPAAAIGLTGSVQTAAGAGIPQARVKVFRGQVLREESYDPISLRPVRIGESGTFLATDAEGRFHHPPVFDCDYVMLEVSAPGYVPIATPFVATASRLLTDGLVDLGVVRLHPLPRAREVRLACLDAATGQPLAGVEWVAAGLYTAVKEGSTDAAGGGKLTLGDRPVVLAAQRAGYQASFLAVSPAEDQVTVRLQPSTPDYVTATAGWNRVAQRAAGQGPKAEDWIRELFQELDPISSDATFYRFSQYFRSLAIADPEVARQALQSADQNLPYPYNLWRDSLPFLTTGDVEDTARFLRSADWAVGYKLQLLLSLALGVADVDLREELLAESALLATQNTGSGGDWPLVAFLAQSLLMAGYDDAAQSVVQQAWARDTVLHEALQIQRTAAANDPQAVKRLGEIFAANRRALPILAIVAPDEAWELIRQEVDPDQREPLEQEYLMFLGMQNLAAMQAHCRQAQVKMDGRATYPLTRHASSFGGVGRSAVAFAQAMADELPVGAERVALSLLGLRTAESGSLTETDARDSLTTSSLSSADRGRLVEQVVQVWRTFSPPYAHVEAEMLLDSLSHLERINHLAPADLDALVIAGLRKSPANPRIFRDLTVLGCLSKLLAMREPDLARVFLEPYFLEDRWFDVHGPRGVDYLNNPLIGAAVWADPAWAVEVTRQKAAEVGRFQPLHQWELSNNAIRELARIGRLRGP
jgi:hypothetical protein